MNTPKKIGTSSRYLKSFRWVKPGIAEARVIEEGCLPDSTPSTASVSLPIAMSLESYEEDWNEGIGTRTWIYRAGRDLPKSPSDPNGDGPSEVWSIDVSLVEKPLVSHANIEAIMSKYGGVLKGGTVEFAQKLSDGKANPLYGVDSYLFPAVMVTVEKTSPGVPVSLSTIKKLGYIDTIPASGFGCLGSLSGGDKKFLLVEHNVRREGNDTVERQVWRWGGIGGWVKQIYQKDYWGN